MNTASIAALKFQFHTGSIKNLLKAKSQEHFRLFQFHTGSIKKQTN